MAEQHKTNTNKISIPTVPIKFTKDSQKYLELQSGRKVFYTNMPEVRYIQPILQSLNPKIAVDLGSGIGRATIYLFRLYGWDNTKFYLYDGNSGEETHYGPNRENLDEFYNSQDETIQFCRENGIRKARFVNAETTKLDAFPLEIDIFYSFLAFGFHWNIHHILPDIWNKLKEGGIAIFGTQGADKEDGDAFTEKQVNEIDLDKWEIVQNERRPHLERSSVLVLRKKI